MKHLLTIINCFAVLVMSAQTDYPFPWNPDADLDGWVSTEDLLHLLTVFGTQFEPETWETDSISAAVVLDGNHNYFQCQSYCNDIEGNWRMADLDAFGRHFDLASSVSAYFWVNGNDKLNSSDFAYDTYQLYGPTGNMDNVNVNNFSQAKKCMCYIQSSPFVPSQYTEDSNLALWSSVSDLQGQVDSLQTALDSLQTSNPTIDSSATVSSQYSLECVEMGSSMFCPAGLGLSSQATLTPDDNYTYPIEANQGLNSEDYITQPLWRKFKISGLPNPELVSTLRVTYWTDSDNFSEISIQPVNEDNDIFFWIYGRRYGCQNWSWGGGQPCCEEELPPNIPLESAIEVETINYCSPGCGTQSYNKNDFSIYAEGDGFFYDTGIRFTKQ